MLVRLFIAVPVALVTWLAIIVLVVQLCPNAKIAAAIIIAGSVASVVGGVASVLEIRTAGARTWGVLALAGLAPLIASATWAHDALHPRPHTLAPYTATRLFWDLPNGSRIRYDLDRGDRAGNGRAPVVYVHGGPAVPGEPGGATSSRLTKDGYDVYHYDQIGTGLSSRLSDPAGYTLQRNIDDIEAIRRKLGVARLILIGQSSGAELAAAYAAEHPERIKAIVFVSPARIRDVSLPGRATNATYRSLISDRRMRTYRWLMQHNQRMARSLVSDSEADGYMQSLFDNSPGSFCGKPRIEWGGAAYLPFLRINSDTAARPDVLEQFGKVKAPILVIRGACDWVDPSAAVAFASSSAAGVSTACIEGAGHDVSADAPLAYLQAVRAFLADPPTRPTKTIDTKRLLGCRDTGPSTS